jgi:hypothetical protein
MMQSYMKIEEADLLETYCKTLTGVIDASVSHRTANVLIRFEGDRENVIRALSAFHYEEHADLPVIDSGRELSDEFENRVILHVAKRFAKRLFLPLPVRSVLTLLKSWRYILPGVKAILSGKIEVSVLDAATVGISMALGDFDTAADIMFLLGLSEILEEYTHRKSVDDLARSMSLNVDQVWQVLDDGTQILVPLQQIQAQDLIAVTRGSMIPLDGVVDYGSCEVNQASLTGESMPVSKQPGAYVYAGTVVEEGECVIRVTASAGEGRYDRIVSMIEDSEKLKQKAFAIILFNHILNVNSNKSAAFLGKWKDLYHYDADLLNEAAADEDGRTIYDCARSFKNCFLEKVDREYVMALIKNLCPDDKQSVVEQFMNGKGIFETLEGMDGIDTYREALKSETLNIKELLSFAISIDRAIEISKINMVELIS